MKDEGADAEEEAFIADATKKRERQPSPRGSSGTYLGIEHFGGQAYYHYRAEQGTWVSAALEERGYAAVYAKETGYGAYRGVVRSPTGEVLSNPDWIQPGQEYYVPVLPSQAAQRPELGAARATARDEGGRSLDQPGLPGGQAQDLRTGAETGPAERGLAAPQARRAGKASRWADKLGEALRAADQLTAFDALLKPVQDVITRGEATWPDGTPVRPEDFERPPRARPAPSAEGSRGGAPGPGTDRELLVANLGDTLLALNRLTAFDLLPPSVQEAVLRGEATWPDGTPVRPDDMSRLKEERRRGLKPLYRELLRPGEREPSIEEQAQLGGLLRVFLMLLATDPTVADRIVQDALFFRYPDDQAERGRAFEYFWQMIFDPLLWLSLNPAALGGSASEGLLLSRQWSQLARGAGSWSLEANQLLGEASTLARAGRVPEAVALARRAQGLAVLEADRLTAARGLGETSVPPTPPVIASAAGNATTVQEARILSDSVRLNPGHNPVATPAFTLKGEAYWGPFYRSSRGIAETLQTGELGGRGPSVGAAFPDNPSAMAYMRNHPVIEQAVSEGLNRGDTLSFYTKVRPERYYGNGAMWPLREETFGLGGVGEIRAGMHAGKIDGNDAAFVEVFFVQLD